MGYGLRIRRITQCGGVCPLSKLLCQTLLGAFFTLKEHFIFGKNQFKKIGYNNMISLEVTYPNSIPAQRHLIAEFSWDLV